MASDLRTALTNILLDPSNQPILSIIKGARNGLVYGAKIRFPHALVMVSLFGAGTTRQRWKKIITATRQHATRLALYVTIYKSVLLVLRDLFRNGKQSSIDPFVAGMLSGWYMFGERTPVNEQIVLYCVSRCLAALLPRERVPKDYPPNKVLPIDNTAHQIFAAVTWGSVMWLFVNERRRLNGGLVNSMDCTYAQRTNPRPVCFVRQVGQLPKLFMAQCVMTYDEAMVGRQYIHFFLTTKCWVHKIIHASCLVGRDASKVGMVQCALRAYPGRRIVNEHEA